MQNSVPKFASFRPKSDPRREELSRPDAERARSHRHDHGRHKSEDPRSVHQPAELGRPTFLHTRGKERIERQHKYAHGYVDELFEVDQRGDQNNMRYGTNSKWNVPSYREPYERSLLGAERMRNSSSLGNVLARLSHEDRTRLNKTGRLVAPSKPDSEEQIARDLQRDFLPLVISRKRKRGSPRPSDLGFSYDRTTDYNANPDEDIDDGTDESSRSDSVFEDELQGHVESNNAMHTQLRRLQGRVKGDPSNVEGWLEYVDFQQDWVACGLAFQTTHSSNADLTVASKLQLAIINDALKAVSSTHSKREALVLRRLDIGRHLWSRDKLEKEWKDSIAHSHRSPLLLLGYINHCRSSAEAFQWEAVRDLFIEVFELLPKSSFSAAAAAEEKASWCYLDCTLGLTSFLRASGFIELAIAVWQVLIELCGSDDIFQSTDATILESMWNSGRIRHGDTGLQSLRSNALAVEAISREDKIDIWAEDEIAYMSQEMLPLRSTDDLDEDDPYRVVLYSDIQPYVESWPVYRLPDVLSTFLNFCGLPPMLGHRDTLVGDYGHSIMPLDREARTSQQSLFLPGTSWLAYTDTMFAADDDLISSFRDVPRDGFLIKLAANALEEVVRRSVKSTPQLGHISEYFMALTYHLAPKSARKMAKTLLDGGESSCIRLYHSLALIEARQKGAYAADRVFILALKMSKHYAKQQPAESLCLWGSWIREALLAGDVSLALRRIASIGLEDAPADLVIREKPAQSQILRTRDHLRRARDLALSRGEPMVGICAAQLLITLTYLTTLNISSTAAAALTHITYFERYMPSTSSGVTTLHQHLAVLLYTHVTKRLAPYAPADLEAALLPSVAALPTNGLILNIYAILFTHSSRLDDRVRSAVRRILHVDQKRVNSEVPVVPIATESTLTDHGSTTQSDIPHLFAIQTELSRLPELGSTSVSIRAAFERAISSPECAHSERIWALYLDYECTQIPTEPDMPFSETSNRQQRKDSAKLKAAREKVKSVFYRGLSVLPGSKAWAMRAFCMEALRRALNTAEKQAVVQGMSARGLRLHNEMDEESM